MSTEQLEDIKELGQRAIACKRWRWMPGMLSDKGLRVFRRDDDGYVVGYYANQEYISQCVPGSLPDLTDPATLGCLLALVREAHRDPKIHMVWLIGGFDTWQPWNTERPVLAPLLKFHTEVAALVAALEVAP